MSTKYKVQSSKVYKIRLKKGDTVIVRSGKHKGQTGKITAVHPTENTVTVEGINIVKKHQKPNKAYPQGGIIEITKPISVSKVAMYDSVNKKPSRIGFEIDKDGNKKRVLKTSGKEVK
ncbi:MAG: 50S ribosomal protein L24 [Candidatus Saccharibacteria bacterium]|nr:50S ribosomal protein L24 [Candidatus Saccharibacteria bacterium]